MSQFKACEVDGCDRKVYAKGLCSRHYQKLRKYGNPTEDRTGNIGQYERPDRRCSLDGCDRKHYGNGYCERHWIRWKNHGDPHYVTPRSEYRPRPQTPVFERIEGKYVVSEGCWEWTGAKTSDGYGIIGEGGKHSGNLYAHRVAWEKWRGPIPEGAEVDHLCYNTSCINPDHLEPVTPRVNKDRARLGRDGSGRFTSLVD